VQSSERTSKYRPVVGQRSGNALGKGWVPMQQSSIDRVARALTHAGSRRQALAVLSAALLGAQIAPASGKKRKRDSSQILQRKRRKSEQRGGKKRDKDSRGKNEGFPRDCRRFVIAAGPDRDDKFRHIDDDLLIELIPKGKNGGTKVLLEDDNNSPNGNNGDHLKVNTFIVGGCELDEIWIHCIEGRGGKVKLTDAITPEECRGDQNRVGVFEDRTVRIRNK
jgi:hypothetical protein